ncbi:MAG TPA: discoidin domain-containing protein, partial [Armatimonadota bacterium]|nr:discoidin domain-containing protein [Armatimonadota bacterium]
PIVAIPASTTKSEPLDKTSTCAVRADILLSGQPFSIYGPWQRWNLAGIENNLAQKAKVSVSSLQGGTISDGAVDGVISGYPASHSYEWASNKEQAGAWIRLDWDEEVTIDRIWLFDRPNLDDHILSGEITFSDGTTLKVGELANDASDGVELSFPAKKVRWLKFTATEVGEKNVNTGLSEIAVFKAR